jgi:hypothetical protein
MGFLSTEASRWETNLQQQETDINPEGREKQKKQLPG